MLKLYCSKCHSFMKEIKPDEAKYIQGNEICKECEETARTILQKLNTEYSKLSQDLASRHNKAVLKLEEIIRSTFDE